MSFAIGSQFSQRDFTWTNWKTVYAIKGSPLQYNDDGTMYSIWAYDGPEVLTCQIWKGTVPDSVANVSYSQAQNDLDKSDFEANYKPTANLPISQLDTDGAQIVRNKAAKKGWTFCAAGMEFSTSTLLSLVCKLFDGTDRLGVTVKYFNASDVEITSSLFIGNCVKTVLDFEPPYDYELIGGSLRHNPIINTDVRVWIVAAPDVPGNYGGSKEMASNLNLKYLAPSGNLEVDGRVSKYLTYSATTHSSKLRFIFKHSAGDTQNIHIVIEHYKA